MSLGLLLVPWLTHWNESSPIREQQYDFLRGPGIFEDVLAQCGGVHGVPWQVLVNQMHINESISDCPFCVFAYNLAMRTCHIRRSQLAGDENNIINPAGILFSFLEDFDKKYIVYLAQLTLKQLFDAGWNDIIFLFSEFRAAACNFAIDQDQSPEAGYLRLRCEAGIEPSIPS